MLKRRGNPAPTRGTRKNGLPKPAVVVNHNTGVVTDAVLEVTEQLLHIPQVIENVTQYHCVKYPLEPEIMRVRTDKSQVRVTLFRLTNHLGREINPHPIGWLERIQQITTATTNFQNPQAFRNHHPVHMGQPLVIAAAHFAAGTLGNPIPVGNTFLAK